MNSFKLTRNILLISFSVALISTTFAQAAAGVVNGSFEMSVPGDINKPYGWQSYGDTGSNFRHMGVAHTGQLGLELKSANRNSLMGVSQRINLNQTGVKPVFIGAWVRGENIVKASGSYFGATLYAEIHLQNGQVVYWNTIANEGTFNWRWIGFNTGTLASVNAPISYINIVPLLGRASGTAYFDDVTVQEFAPRQSAVSLVFDDGEENTWSKASPVLQNHGMIATVAIPVETIGASGYMTQNQLTKLINRGWEVMSHSVNHVNLTTLSSAEALNQLRESKTDLRNELGVGINSFALPEGAYNGFIIGEGQKYYRSIRAFELGDNPQGTFPYEVKVRSVVNTTTLSEVESWLNSARQGNRWEVIVFHTIKKSGDDPYHISRAGFQDIIRTIEASGIPVITYNEGLNRFAVSK